MWRLPSEVRTKRCWPLPAGVTPQLTHGGFRVLLRPYWSAGLHGTAQLAVAVADNSSNSSSYVPSCLCVRVCVHAPAPAHVCVHGRACSGLEHVPAHVSLKPQAPCEFRAIIIPIAPTS